MANKEDIIAAVRKYPHLWDASHKDHSDKRVIQKIWSHISTEMGGTEEDLKSKWRNIRDYYRKEVKKLQKHKISNGGEHVKSNWPLFPLLSFLNDTIVLSESSDTNISLENDPFLEIVESVQEEGDDNFADMKASSDLEELLKDDDSGTNDTADTSTSRVKRTVLKRSHTNDYKSRLLELEARKIAILEKEITDDEDLMFFKSLLPDFKSLPRNRRVYLKLKYQEMLYDEIRLLSTIPPDQLNLT